MPFDVMYTSFCCDLLWFPSLLSYRQPLFYLFRQHVPQISSRRWSAVAGGAWERLQGEATGQTQVDNPNDGEMAKWAHPIGRYRGQPSRPLSLVLSRSLSFSLRTSFQALCWLAGLKKQRTGQISLTLWTLSSRTQTDCHRLILAWRGHHHQERCSSKQRHKATTCPP